MEATADTATVGPLSCGQERLWFLNQLRPSSSSYLVTARFRVVGPLDTGLLEAAVRQVMDRHEVLRAAFAVQGRRPVQVVRPLTGTPLEVVDVTGLDAAAREPAWEDLSREQTTRAFDLASGPLIRVTVTRLSDEDHGLTLAAHHIVLDRSSADIFLAEVGEVYRAGVEGRAPDLRPLPIQYVDVARRQREWLDGPECAEQVEYWRTQLDGAPPVLPLGGASGRPRRSVEPAAGGEPLDLDVATVGRLRAFAEEERASTFMVLLAAYGATVGRWYGLTELVIACPVTNRLSREVDGLIGFFVNTLPIRVSLRERMSFRELVGEVRRCVFGALEHQDLPFDRIVSAVAPPRQPGRPPFFQVVLNFTVAGSPFELPGVTVTELPVHRIAARAELALDVVEGAAGAGLGGELLYDPDLQPGDRVAGLVAALRRTLRTVLGSPDARL